MVATPTNGFGAMDDRRTGFPVYVRKLSRGSRWKIGSPDDIDESQVEVLVKSELCPQQGRLSVYKVSTETELAAVAVGLNSMRDSLHEKIDYVAIWPDDLEAVSVSVEATPGNTGCHCANRLHRDLLVDESVLYSLVRRLWKAQRQKKRLAKSKMKEYAHLVSQLGCKATVHDKEECVGADAPEQSD